MVLAFSSFISSSHRYVQGAVTAESISLVVLFETRLVVGLQAPTIQLVSVRTSIVVVWPQRSASNNH